ncbi:ABC transporter permease [Ruminococcus gauvreauii]|uniref:ABC transporter permease n=1 Tax=Ruminococcus gauvreauii TaxID=438033 RepID=A0ABY5VCL9_9FIRM|nr:ABC transporter permease [Ruminococcus gauvreauii]UWP58300.1 ABC transporter permease [Ruminococcus gauvreauii]
MGKHSNFLEEIKQKKLTNYLPFLVLIVLSIGLEIATKGVLFSLANIGTMTNTIFPMIIVAMGAVFVYSHGGIDLSVGSLLGLCMMETLLIVGDSNVLTAGKMAVILLATIATGFLVGLLNGLMTAKLKLQPLIMTLCMNYILRGIVTAVTELNPAYAPAQFSRYDNIYVKFILILVIVAGVILVFEKTRYGKNLKAIGGNEQTAKQSGIKVDNAKIAAYIIVGVTVAIAGSINVIRASMVRANTGSGFEIDIFLALLLGGIPLSGGAKVRSWCAVIGCVILVILESGLLLCGLQHEHITILKGLLFIGMVAMTFERSRGEAIA